jgi:hypothetical protein
MAIPPQQNHRITLAQAIAYTSRFRAAFPDAIKANLFWNSGGVSDLMTQKTCAGIRIYNGLDDKGVPVPVLVAVDANGEDMTSGVLLEVTLPCPPHCPESSPLGG